MQINSNLFGRAVEVTDPTHSGKTEIMIFQGMTASKKYGDILYAVCMNSNGEVGIFPIDRVRFIGREKEQTDILRCSLVPVPKEMFESEALVGRDDIYDDQYHPVKITTFGRSIVGYDYEGEPKYSYYVMTYEGVTYSFGSLYWKGVKEVSDDESITVNKNS